VLKKIPASKEIFNLREKILSREKAGSIEEFHDARGRNTD